MEPMITRGLMACTCSQENPKRSSTPGPKFSIRMSLFLSNSVNIALPSGDLMLIERLLQFSMVKYRLSALGTSRNWPRVASPAGDSSLITSAPIQASSCEQVGPACTCVMSRTRIPLSASILSSLLCLAVLRRGRLLVHGLVGSARRIYIAIDDDVHQRRQAGIARFLERRPDVLGLRYADAEAAHRFRQPVEAHVAHNVANVAAAWVFPLLPEANLVPGRVIADHA